jgi:hypothetical protein
MSAEPITTYCPVCGKTFHLPPELNGKKIVCKGCQTHFVVQPDKPGLPAAAPAPKPAAPARAVAVAAPAAKAATPVHAAPAAAAPAPPAAPAPATAELPPIPFDDAPVPLIDTGGESAMPTVVKPQALEKVKIESKGPYFVVKLVTVGKMIHVGLENTLNEHAADGWRLQQILSVHDESYAIFYRERNGSPQ